MVIDHIGIVVRSISESIPVWESVFGYHQLTAIVTNSFQKVRVAFLAKDGSLSIKLVEPTDTSSPVHALAQRGGGLHHLCFRAASVTAEVARLRLPGSPHPCRGSTGGGVRG